MPFLSTALPDDVTVLLNNQSLFFAAVSSDAFPQFPRSWKDLGEFWKLLPACTTNVLGKELDNLLQPVLGYGNIEYLTEEQIDFLGLNRLHYFDIALLVREEYKVAYNHPRSYEETLVSRGGGVVVTGQPGIGNYYLLFRLLSEKQSVAFQVADKFIQRTGILRYSITATAQLIRRGTWALTDSHTDFDNPYPAFLAACAATNSWVVQTTSPSRAKWASWKKECRAITYWMCVFPLDQLNAFGSVQQLSYSRRALRVVKYSIPIKNIEALPHASTSN